MTRKRPVFVKEYSSSDEEEYYEYEEENYDERNVKISAKTKKAKRKKVEVDGDETELENADTEHDNSTELNSDTTELDDSTETDVTELDTDSEDSKDVVEEIQEPASTVTATPTSTYAQTLNLMITKPDLGKLEEGENFVIKIDKYWPFGLYLDEPVAENKNLLYLYSLKLLEDFETCEACHDKSAYKELNLNVKCSLVGHMDIEQSSGRFPAALAKFMEKNDSNGPRNFSFEYLMKPKCCSKAKSKRITFDSTGISRSPLLKYFTSKSLIHVYLKVDRQSIPLIPKNIDKIINGNLKQKYCQPLLKKWTTPQFSGIFSDTFDFPEAEIPEGFSLNLRSYQLRSISWMKEVESAIPSEANTIAFNFLNPNLNGRYIKLKLGETPYYVEFNQSKAVTRSAETTKMNPLRFYGGVLADDTGSGKTATTLGLIHSSPFNDEKYQQRLDRFNVMSHYHTGATLIVCPSNIYKQWIAEAKKCNPKFKIYGFSTILDHRKVSTQDIIEADIVVVSYQFLINSNYNDRKRYCGLSINSIFNSVKGYVNIHHFHYHRMILDEFHELEATSKNVRESVKNFRADFVWGLTGTPNSDILKQLFEYNVPSLNYNDTCSELKYKHVKRNAPNLELPPIETETVWIDLSAHELALLRWKGRESSKREEIMMCSHYQLNEKENVSVNEFMTVENAQKKMSEKKSKEIDNLKRELIQIHALMEHALKEKPDANISSYQSRLKSVEHKLASAQSNLNYFQNVFKVIGEPDKNGCLICYDTIPSDSLSILPCSHLYCYGCIKGAIETCQACPLCRSPATLKEIFCIRIKEKETVSAALGEIDTSLYSSKLIGLYRYVTDLIQRDPNARIILFLQFSDLADFIGKSFKDFGVEYVRVAGNVFQRQNAISKFRESKNVRLIMMSSEDSVSGINLTQATHVILLHPFWTGNEATDLAYEKQGISRAYRFGLEHPLKIVRFAVRGSIEEEITIRREKIKFSN